MFGIRRSKKKLNIAIIGSGIGGIAAAVNLKRAGFTNFIIFERAGSAGGTWRDNRYPGCEVDIHSHLYSYSFMPYDWSRTHARQPELLRYLNDTIDHFRFRNRIRFNTAVDTIRWDDQRQCYQVEIAGGSVEEFHVVISAVGVFNTPKIPNWPGLDTFEGQALHTTEWSDDIDLRGKTVAVIGTGSTGAQLVSEVAGVVGHLYLFQREPGWVIPKGDRDYTTDERLRYCNSKLFQRRARFNQIMAIEKLLRARAAGSGANEAYRKLSLDHMSASIPNAEVRDALTPKFPFGCKRLIQEGDYYPQFARDNVTLVPHAVERLTKNGIVAADGIERKVAIVIMGVGFEVQDYLSCLKVVGLDRRDLHQTQWKSSPRAFLGVTVPNFPNFFILYGPNTNGGASIIYQVERQSEAIVRLLKRITPGRTSIDTTQKALDWWVRWIDKVNERISGQTTRACHNYFYGADGRNVTQWPLPAFRYSFMLRTLMRWATRVRRPHMKV